MNRWYMQHNDESQNNCAEWKKADKKEFTMYNSIKVQKLQINSSDIKPISGCLLMGVGMGIIYTNIKPLPA